MKRIPMQDGDEFDALTKWKKNMKFKTGERRRVKKKYNRRERRQARLKYRVNRFTEADQSKE